MQQVVAVLHVLSGSAWLGAMAYSLFLLQPRAHAFFPQDTDFEHFITTVSQGARWKVLGSLGLMGLTGLALLLLSPRHEDSSVWVWLIAAKAGLWLFAVLLFVHVSWRMWPARVMALPEEIPGIQRAFRRVGLTLLAIASLEMILGVLAHG